MTRVAAHMYEKVHHKEHLLRFYSDLFERLQDFHNSIFQHADTYGDVFDNLILKLKEDLNTLEERENDEHYPDRLTPSLSQLLENVSDMLIEESEQFEIPSQDLEESYKSTLLRIYVDLLHELVHDEETFLCIALALEHKRNGSLMDLLKMHQEHLLALEKPYEDKHHEEHEWHSDNLQSTYQKLEEIIGLSKLYLDNPSKTNLHP